MTKEADFNFESRPSEIPEGYYWHKKSATIKRKTRRTHHGNIPYTINPDQIARFWEKVNKTDGCWLWTGSTQKFGYGNLTWEGRSARAHKVSFLLAGGIISKGLQVLHKCDNPPCVNPDHLFLGTQQDNVRDCIAKGRFPQKKLSNDIVKEIRDLYAAGDVSQRQLARRYGVRQSHIWRILKGGIVYFPGVIPPHIEKPMREEILEMLSEFGPMTDRQMAAHYRTAHPENTRYCLRPERLLLVRDGLVRDSGKRIKAPNGCNDVVVWESVK